MSGFEAAYIPYILAAAGTAASVVGQREANQDRRAILNRQLETTDQASDKANSMVLDEAQNYAPDARLKALQDEQAARYARTQGDLQSAGATGAGGALIDSAGDAGNVSQDFLTAKNDRMASEGDRLGTIASELAKTRGVGGLLQKEGMRRGGLAGNLSNLWSTTRNVTGAGGLDAQNVQEPLYGQLGGLAAQMAMLYGGAGAGTPATSGAEYGLGTAQLGDAGNTANTWLGKSAGRVRFG
jgi:hypothetical protein